MTEHTITVDEIVRALDDDTHPASNWMISGNSDRRDRRELFLGGLALCMWVRASGYCVSGWRRDPETTQMTYFHRTFYERLPFRRWRIRLAVRRWARRRAAHLESTS